MKSNLFSLQQRKLKEIGIVSTMSSSDNTFDTTGIIHPEDIEEITKIDKNHVAMYFTESTGLVSIDTSENSAAGKTFSNIHIIKMKNKRYLIIADISNIYSSAQLKDIINKNKNKSTPKQILNYYGIDNKDYFFQKLPNSPEMELIFRKQKLISTYKKNIKIDCPNYTIISES